MSAMAEPLLSVRNLGVVYETAQGPVHAVTDVSFDVMENEVFGIAGESGCGKSTLIKALLRLLSDNGTATADRCSYRGRALMEMEEEAFRKDILWQEISLVVAAFMGGSDASPAGLIILGTGLIGLRAKMGRMVETP